MSIFNILRWLVSVLCSGIPEKPVFWSLISSRQEPLSSPTPLIVTSLVDVNNIICHYANVDLWMPLAYNSVRGSWIQAVKRKMPANSSPRRSCVQLESEEINALWTSVTFTPCLQETKSFSGCGFNESTVRWQRKFSKIAIFKCIYWLLYNKIPCEEEDLLSDRKFPKFNESNYCLVAF